jgi:hypothetical protein
MQKRIFNAAIDLVTTEQERRAAALGGEASDYAEDQWLFVDAPFLNEVCLMVLVALRHQVERELLSVAARTLDGGGQITLDRYQANLTDQRREAFQKPGQYWKSLTKRLKLATCKGYAEMEVLRALANSYKHETAAMPNEALLDSLDLAKDVNYAPLAESAAVQSALAVLVGLDAGEGYPMIAQRFVDLVGDFVAEVKAQSNLSQVERKPVSFRPSDMAH